MAEVQQFSRGEKFNVMQKVRGFFLQNFRMSEMTVNLARGMWK